ncbi:MAG: isoprenylcysteine carboxylmethyltransferase family protein, partial [Thermoplasmata archaeon]|nr:isoprenylcysteine carboxylmethyltransferase family protein [Thermoplasmata archaeon]
AVRRVPRLAHLGWLTVSVLVPFGFLVVAVLFPGVVYATPLNFGFPGDLVLQLLAVALFGVGGALIVWSDRHLGRYMVVDIAVAQDHELITTGPYGYVRHPTYTGVLLVNLAALLFFLHVGLVINFFLVLAIATWRARLEEGLLSSEEGFGSRYQLYVQGTGRFLPRSFRRFE